MLGVLIALLLAAAAGAYFYFSSAVPAKPAPPAVPAPAPKPKAAKVDITAKKSTSAAAAGAARKASDASSAAAADADDVLVYRHLRGHQGEITGLAVSGDGRHIASVAHDEQLRLWTVVDGERNTHFARHNLPKGHYGTAVAISADDKYLAMAVSDTRQVQIFGIKDDRAKNQAFLVLLHSFPTPHKQSITTIKIASNNAFIATMAEGSTDLNLHLFSMKGGLIQTLSVAQILNYTFALSDDARFLAAATKLSDTKIWEVTYAKPAKGAPAGGGGAPATVQRVDLVTTLKGHKRGVRCVAFGAPETGPLVVSASADGAWAEHSLRVRYAQQEDPKLRSRTVVPEFASSSGGGIELIDIAPPVTPAADGAPTVVALAAGTTLQFWRTDSAVSASSSSSVGSSAASQQPRLLHSIPHAHKGPITHLQFTHSSGDSGSGSAAGSGARSFLVTAGEGKTITVWRAPHLDG